MKYTEIEERYNAGNQQEWMPRMRHMKNDSQTPTQISQVMSLVRKTFFFIRIKKGRVIAVDFFKDRYSLKNFEPQSAKYSGMAVVL